MAPRILTDITVCIHAETDKAVLVSDNGEIHKSAWLPKSQIEIERTGQFDQSNDRVGAKKLPIVTVTLPEWLAVNKGFA